MAKIKEVKQPFAKAMRLLYKAYAEIRSAKHAEHCVSWAGSPCDCNWPELEKELNEFIVSQWAENEKS